jgi:hypothetical protein
MRRIDAAPARRQLAFPIAAKLHEKLVEALADAIQLAWPRGARR